MTDSIILNAAVNDPSVLPSVAPGFEVFDLTEFITCRDNVALYHEGATAIFERKAEGVFEGHYFFPAEVRGKAALTAARKMVEAMFTTYGARVIEGHVPRTHRAARVLTRALGFTPVGESRDTSGRSCVHYKLGFAEWAASSELGAENEPPN